MSYVSRLIEEHHASAKNAWLLMLLLWLCVGLASCASTLAPSTKAVVSPYNSPEGFNPASGPVDEPGMLERIFSVVKLNGEWEPVSK